MCSLFPAEGDGLSFSHQPEGSKVTHGVTCSETPTSHYISESCSHGNGVMYSDPDVSAPPASHPMIPAAEGRDLPSEMMDLFESLDLLGGSLSDLQELDFTDPEPSLSESSDDSSRTGHPVRSLVEWVKGHQTH